MDGFKTLERRDVPVSAGDRVALGTLTIELGALSETVTVSGEAPLIQARSGERSLRATTEAIENLPVSNRNWTSHGGAGARASIGTTRLGGGGNNNFQLDGVTTMDTGSNGQMLQLNTDAIAEVKVVTQGYRGRIRPGERTADFGHHQERLEPVPRIVLRHQSAIPTGTRTAGPTTRNGVAEGGVQAAGLGVHPRRARRQTGRRSNKLFFFYAHQYSRRAQPAAGIPTASACRPPRTAGRLLAIRRQQQRRVQSDPRRLHRPAVHGRRYAGLLPGRRRAREDPGESTVSARPEHPQSVADAEHVRPRLQLRGHVPPIDERTTHQPVIRADYQVSAKLRVTGKYAGQRATVKPTARFDSRVQRHAQQVPVHHQLLDDSGLRD